MAGFDAPADTMSDNANDPAGVQATACLHMEN
jgi:hypothetical protein